MDMKKWVESVLQALAGLSRTLGGVSDTSSASEKPKLVESEGEALARRTRENLEHALEFLWENSKQHFASPAEVRQFVDALAAKVSKGLLQPGQSLYRTWETKFRQTPVAEIETEYQRFCEWLFEALADADAVKTAALVEKRLDGKIHPFADGCGRTSKLLAAFVLLRAGLSPVSHRSRSEYYSRINASDEEWIRYYRALGAERR
jgi:Fic family protein